MRDLITNFLTASITNTHPMVMVALCGIYLLLVLNCFLSMRSNRMSLKATGLFTFLILAIPFVGIAIYVLWNLSKCDFNSVKNLLGNDRPKKSH